MSRVPADTFFVRVFAAVALSLGAAGCGGDDAETASAPAAATSLPSTPVAPTTPTSLAQATTPSSEEQKPNKADSEPRNDAQAAAPGVETPQTVAKASPKKQSNDGIAGQMKRAYDALKSEGFELGKPAVTQGTAGVLQVDGTTIVFYPSPREAAEFALKVTKVQPEVKLARKANRLFLFVALPTKPADEQAEDFRRIRKITNGAI